MSPRALYWGVLASARRARLAMVRELRPALVPWQQRCNGGIFAADIHARIGLFAQLNMALRIVSFCDSKGLRPYVSMTGPLYAGSGGSDVFEAFFDNVALTAHDRHLIASRRIRVSRIEEIEDLGLSRSVFEGLTLERAHKLLHNYMPPKKWLICEVEDFVNQHFRSGPVLGLHYRGTDKSSEAEPVQPDLVIDAVNRYIAGHPTFHTVFVASDEQSFVEFAARQIVGARVVAHEDELRSRDGKAIHSKANAGDPTQKAHEALMNSLLLSRCDVLVRTASFLSAWASVFNPRLPVLLLNQPFAHTLWFPDSEIVKRAGKVCTTEHSGSLDLHGTER